MEPSKVLLMNKKWEKRKFLLNKKRMVENMSDIQQAMIEISDIAYQNRNFVPNSKDVNKVSDFKSFILNLLNELKNKS